MAGLRDRLGGLLTDRDTSAWSGSVEDLLYEGERVEASVGIDDSRVVVTGHRVLAFTPGGDGENFRQVDRPNVTGVRTGGEGDDGLLYRGLRTGVYAVVLLAVGVFVDFGSFLPTTSIDTSGAGSVGVGGMIATMNRVLALFARLDDLLRLFGALALFLTAVMLGVYALTRDRVIVISVAGDVPDVHVPAPSDADRRRGAVDDLDAALFGGGNGDRDGNGNGTAVAGERGDGPSDSAGGGPGDHDAGEDSPQDARFKSDGPL